MWSRLTKKMTANLTAAAHDNEDGNEADAGEGPSEAPPTKVTKKRKTTGTRGGSSAAKGKIPLRA